MLDLLSIRRFIAVELPAEHAGNVEQFPTGNAAPDNDPPDSDIEAARIAAPARPTRHLQRRDEHGYTFLAHAELELLQARLEPLPDEAKLIKPAAELVRTENYPL